jgi:hypothetical protein
MKPVASETSLQAVERVFTWFNDLGARKIPLDRADVERLFSPDLALMIDMKVMAKGTDAMVQRMTEMLAKTRWWGVTPLPFEFCLTQDNMAAAYYQYHFIDPAGVKGKLHIVAIWRVQDGKIAEVKEIKQIEEGQIELQQYGN